MGSRFVTILWSGLLLIMHINSDHFVDDRALDQSAHISWRGLPDREEEGLGELLTGILERSRNAAQRHPPATDDNDAPMTYAATVLANIVRSPGPDDYPLWRVRCRVSRLLRRLYQKLKQSNSQAWKKISFSFFCKVCCLITSYDRLLRLNPFMAGSI
jgi:hypothetical protein